MADEVELVGVDHIGGAPSGPWSEWKKLRFVFQDFEGMNQECGRCVRSSVMECHGHKWLIQLYPRGNGETSGYVSVYLRCDSVVDIIAAKVNFIVPSAHFAVNDPKKCVFRGRGDKWGFGDFIRRSKVLDPTRNYLVDGDFVLEVDIRVAMTKLPAWTPTNTVCTDMLKMLEGAASDDDANVLFEVGKGSVTKGEKGKKQFHAHKNILKARCPALSALAEDYDDGTPIPIEDVEPEIFQMMLRFGYGGEIPNKSMMKENARTLISAANRFGCTGLKLAAEAELAAAGITVANAADLILFADGNNCAMLKEAAVDFFVDNSTDVMQSDGFSKIQESIEIMKELMAEAFGSKKRKASSDPEERDYKRMRVAELRQKLDKKGLDVDGSKAMLISRLKDAATVVIE